MTRLGGDYARYTGDDAFFDRIDPGIREAVRLMNERGLATVGSCEGHPDPTDPAYRDGLYHKPWVRLGFASPAAEAECFRNLLADMSERGLRFAVSRHPDTQGWGFATTIYIQLVDAEGLRAFTDFLRESRRRARSRRTT